MSETNSNEAIPPVEGTTPPITETPPTIKTEGTPPALIGTPPSNEWKEFVPDATKTADENAAAKTAHDATKPAPVAETPEAKLAREAAIAPLDFKNIKVPEGFTVDEAVSKEFTDIVNDDKLSRADRAQRLIDLQAKFFSDVATKRNEAWNTMQTDWQAKVQADPEIGGAKLPGNLNAISNLLTTYGSPELREVFTFTGAGNHVEMVKFLTKIAAKLGEGGPVSGSPGDKDGGSKVLYPNTSLT